MLQRPSPIQADLHYLTLLQRQASLLHLGSGYPRAIQAGVHRSRFQGQGMEFDESRLYQPGDDIRNMDWRVTARTGKAHTKVFREERERPAWLMLDLRPAMFFATRGALKAVIASECASLLAWSVLAQGDRIGGFVMDGSKAICPVRPARSSRSVMRLFGLALQQARWQQPMSPVTHQTSLLSYLQNISHLAHAGSLLMLVSDGRGLDEAAQQQIKQLLVHHQIIFVMVYDPFESTLPEAGVLPVSDGQKMYQLDTGNRNIRQQYQISFQQRQQALQALAKHPRFFLMSCATNDDPFTVLHRHLGKHGK